MPKKKPSGPKQDFLSVVIALTLIIVGLITGYAFK